MSTRFSKFAHATWLTLCNLVHYAVGEGNGGEYVAIQALTLGTKVARLAEGRNLTLEQLAEKSGVHKSQIGRIVRGMTRSPRKDTIQALADALDVSVADLMDERPQEDPVYLQLRSLLAGMDDAHKERVLEYATFQYQRDPLVGDEVYA